MFRLLFLSSIFTLFSGIAGASTLQKKVLLVGESLSLPSVHDLQAEKSNSVKIKRGTNGIQIVAIKPGSTEIQTRTGRIQISVLSSRQKTSFEFLQSWVAKNPGLDVDIEKGNVVLSGKAFSPRSWLGIAKACGHCLYISKFQIPKGQEINFKNALHEILKAQSLTQPALRWDPQLEWSLPKGPQRAALLAMADRLGIHVEEDEQSLEIAPMVRTQIFVMEVRREFSRRYGLTWPQSITAQVIPGEVAQFEPLGFSAQALENEGLAKILASPTLLCRSGQEAEFLAGGEFPIKILGYHSQDVIWKKYGIMLKVKPKADRWGRMSITIETEISSIDPAKTVDGLPGLFTNRVSSHFDLEESSTIAISGLIKNEEGRSRQGLPGLSGLPVLGALFGSKEFIENRTELIIFVKPEVVDLKAKN